MRRNPQVPAFGHFLKPSALRHAMRIERDEQARQAHAKAWRSERDGKFKVPNTKGER